MEQRKRKRKNQFSIKGRLNKQHQYIHTPINTAVLFWVSSSTGKYAESKLDRLLSSVCTGKMSGHSLLSARLRAMAMLCF